MNMNTAGVPTILYVDYSPELDSDRRRLDGLRRYAVSRKWRVETLEHKDCSPSSLREALSRLHPVGCAAECWCPETALRPVLFRGTPVVYFSPPDRPGWRGAHGVACDEAAVARMAFRELSDGRPEAFAALSFFKDERWSQERIESFRDCCRKAGFDCPVSYFKVGSYEELPSCVGKLVPWARALPPHCAVFAVNDFCALGAARALAAAGRNYPRSVTLIGADGVEIEDRDKALAATFSTVRLDFELAGFLAAKMVAETAEQGGPAKRTAFFPPLMVDRRKSTRGYGRREPHILEAIEMIRREACDGLTAMTLARRFRCSRRLFNLRFREATGHSVLDEIQYVRLEKVFALLSGTDTAIGAIADFCGFGSGVELRRVFRARMGKSLREWRKENSHT